MHAELDHGRIIIYNSYQYKDRIKMIRGRFWHVDRKVWSVPFTEENILALESMDCKFDKQLQERARLVVMNDIHIPVKSDPLEPMPIKISPYMHQVEAYNRACTSLGIFKGGSFSG